MRSDTVRDYLWTILGLENRSIIFSMIDTDELGTIFDGGIITDAEDSKALFESCHFGSADNPTIHIRGIESWMIGNGESDSADCDDIIILDDASTEFHPFFDDFLRSYADSVSSVGEMTVKNPLYALIHEGDVSENTLRMMDSSMRNLENGIVSDPVSSVEY